MKQKTVIFYRPTGDELIFTTSAAASEGSGYQWKLVKRIRMFGNRITVFYINDAGTKDQSKEWETFSGIPFLINTWKTK